MATIISTINLKGGVGKTQTTVALAEFLILESCELELSAPPKILVIDLDPQTNATIMLIDEERWNQKNIAGETLNQLFKDALLETEEFDITKAIERNVSNIGGGIAGLDLLPSSLDLTDIQESLRNISSPNTVLYGALKDADIFGQYDYILIDCPPNLGAITKNGLYFSDFFLIPTIPDILSTYGIPQIMLSIDKFRKPKRGEPALGRLEPLGILISKYREQNPLHRAKAQELESSSLYPSTFPEKIPDSSDISKAAEFGKPNKYSTLKKKYDKFHYCYLSVAKEVLVRAK